VQRDGRTRRKSVESWHLLVLAKAPVPGRVKTRLCPHLSPVEAAEVAAAALADTLDAVAACGSTRRILALDGAPGDWLPPGFTVVAQRGNTLNERLAAAWTAAGGPGLQIGMDTPQVTPELLNHCLERTASPGASAALGLAEDGGWWALGLARGWTVDVFAGVAMSEATTGADQLGVLRAHGHQVHDLPVLRDLDRIEDLEALARQVPSARVAAAWRRISSRPR
jgi:glycosyltransferase A (GT-A) superfamily protein (DUF2064 family)